MRRDPTAHPARSCPARRSAVPAARRERSAAAGFGAVGDCGGCLASGACDGGRLGDADVDLTAGRQAAVIGEELQPHADHVRLGVLRGLPGRLRRVGRDEQLERAPVGESDCEPAPLSPPACPDRERRVPGSARTDVSAVAVTVPAAAVAWVETEPTVTSPPKRVIATELVSASALADAPGLCRDAPRRRADPHDRAVVRIREAGDVGRRAGRADDLCACNRRLAGHEDPHGGSRRLCRRLAGAAPAMPATSAATPPATRTPTSRETDSAHGESG